MIGIFKGRKCVLCREIDKGLLSVGGYGMYNDEKRYYHRECLKNVTCDPEHHKHIQVDMAISIVEKIDEENKKAVKRRKEFKSQCEKLQNYCVGE